MKKYQGLCPVCHKPLTIGVASRIEELALRPEGFALPEAPKFEKLIELDKIIAQMLGVKSRNSARVYRVYQQLIDNLGDELSILRTVEIKKIESFEDSSREASLSAVTSEKAGAKWGAKLAEGIARMRAGEVNVKPGFDGQYGEVRVF